MLTNTKLHFTEESNFNKQNEDDEDDENENNDTVQVCENLSDGTRLILLTH